MYLAILLIDTNKDNLPNPDVSSNSKLIQVMLTDFFVALGALCFLILVIAGIRYVTSRGNPESVQKAKATIAYALAGLIIAGLAEAIVSFVVGRI